MFPTSVKFTVMIAISMMTFNRLSGGMYAHAISVVDRITDGIRS